MTLKELFNLLEERYPGIKKKVLRGAAVTVNLEYVEFEVDERGDVAGPGAGSGSGFVGGETGEEGKEGEVVIRRGDEVGIIPPVSSG
jgi:molybdopterin synthase sulfur carrier subunit